MTQNNGQNLALDVPQLQSKLQAAWQTIDELLKTNLDLKAFIITNQKQFQEVVKSQSDIIVNLNKEIEELKKKLDFPIPDSPL